MQERRNGNRFSPQCQLEVFNPLRRQRIGTLADLSTGGMQLHSEFRLTMEEEALYWIRLPTGVGQRRWIALSGRVVWRQPNRQNGGYNHGVQTSASCIKQLKRLLEQAAKHPERLEETEAA